MKNVPKVSIITACYNGERFIKNWTRSLLNQTYKNLEILIINDGSEDESGKLLQEAKREIDGAGLECKYFEQKNAGIGPATNVGLCHMSGDYFMIYDIDDLLEPECIERRVEYMECNLDCSMLLTDGWYVHEENVGEKIPFKYFAPNVINFDQEKEYIFDKLLKGERGAHTVPYFYRTEDYLKNNPMIKIYPSPYIQDTCLVLLTSFHNKCGFLADRLYTVLVSSTSHSSEHNRDWRKKLLYSEGIAQAIIETINMLPIGEEKRRKYVRLIELGAIKKCNLALMSQYHCVPQMEEVIIFGAGRIGQGLAEILHGYGCKVRAFLDNNPDKIGKCMMDIPIRGIDSLSGDLPLIILASKQNEDELELLLEKKGLVKRIDFINYKECEYILQNKYLQEALKINLETL